MKFNPVREPIMSIKLESADNAVRSTGAKTVAGGAGTAGIVSGMAATPLAASATMPAVATLRKTRGCPLDTVHIATNCIAVQADIRARKPT
ncbi:hypothetical protein MHIB_37000 [Mycolicibacter hiberniae]|uniref:Uncharacterized protein n=1 Tax=Mycolicibacter hiberniae TaxID=29314 RepID=A0A7I7X730_9MYCO|nr:hypothetical protein MHIB_37000 [Mycolicibacter hiberniae]